MEEDLVLSECIATATQLQRQIQSSCQVPPNCLGGQMLQAYEKAREHQLAIIKIICDHLGVL